MNGTIRIISINGLLIVFPENESGRPHLVSGHNHTCVGLGTLCHGSSELGWGLVSLRGLAPLGGWLLLYNFALANGHRLVELVANITVRADNGCLLK